MGTAYYLGNMIGSVFTLLSTLLLLRFALQAVQADRMQQGALQLFHLTRWVDVFEKWIQPIAHGRISIVVLMVLVVFETINFFLQTTYFSPVNHSPFNALMLVLCIIIDRFIGLYYWLLMGLIILSWVQLFTQRPSVFYDILNSLVQPIVQPFDRIIPPIGPFSLSVMFALMALYVVDSLMDYIIHIWFFNG